MKILVIFIDMIRPNRLSTFNNKIKKNTPLDSSLKELGGTYYTNCFSQGPDTPRGMATFASGEIPYKNGCSTRVKWPRYFLNKELQTIYDLFVEKEYKMTFFSNPNERETGIFPEHISNMDIHNNDYDLNNYLSNTILEENHFVFVGLPDYHWSFEDHSYTTYGEKQAYKDSKKSYDVIFNNFNKDDFDHIFVFSDHGFKFIHEFKREPKYLLLNEDRTNILMIHRQKGQNDIKYDNKLCSIADIKPTMQDILNDNTTSGISLLQNNEREYIIVEDHLEFAPSVNQNIEIWAIIKKDTIYIRTLENGYILDRSSRKMVSSKDETYDNILKKESSFIKYIDEYEKVFRYREFMFKQTTYMYGGKRGNISTFMKYLYILKDFLFEKVVK
jgi:arylsulfatase A-like enzyme